DSRWLIGTTLSKAIGSGSSSTSKACASAVLPRATGRDTRIMCWAGRAFRWRGAVDAGLLARPDRPSRCTLPITALRVTFPSSAAIWLAESPASQSFFNCSTRSSDQVNTVIAFFPSRSSGLGGPVLRCQISKKSLRAESLRVRRTQKARPDVYAETPELLGSDLPHEMSYSTDKTLQYGVTPAQESGVAVHMFHQFKNCNPIFQRTGLLRSLQHCARWRSCPLSEVRPPLPHAAVRASESKRARANRRFQCCFRFEVSSSSSPLAAQETS